AINRPLNLVCERRVPLSIRTQIRTGNRPTTENKQPEPGHSQTAAFAHCPGAPVSGAACLERSPPGPGRGPTFLRRSEGSAQRDRNGVHHIGNGSIPTAPTALRADSEVLRSW